MNEKQYFKINQWVTADEKRLKLIKAVYSYLPYVIGYGYLFAIFFLFFTGNIKIFSFTVVPAMLLMLVSLFRCLVSTERPYEVYSIIPVVLKDKKGKSMPSRHTASAFAVAMAFIHVNIPLGILAFVLAVAVGASRVLCGVHFIRDVVAGAVTAILFDFLGNAFLNWLYEMFVQGLEKSLSVLF